MTAPSWLTKASADILTVPDPAGSPREDDRLRGHQSKPAPRSGKTSGASASLPGDSNGDAHERLLRHLTRLHGLVR